MLIDVVDSILYMTIFVALYIWKEQGAKETYITNNLNKIQLKISAYSSLNYWEQNHGGDIGIRFNISG